MKKLLLSISFLVILGLPKLSAQIINANLETWSRDAIATNTYDPNTGNGSSGWWDFNFDNEKLLGGGSPVTVYEGSNNPAPEDSAHYAIIVSQTMTSQTYSLVTSAGFPIPQTNGVLFTAYMSLPISIPPTLIFKPGIPFNKKIDTLTFWYRYIPKGNDTCSCSVVLSHWSNGARHIIGGGLWTNHSTVSAWKRAAVSITYDSIYSTPDSILIEYSACSLFTSGNPKPGDTLDVDHTGYHVSATAGINNIGAQRDEVRLYPNPAKTEISLAISGNYKAARVEIYDITGRTMGTYSITNNFLTINTQAYNNGLYLYKLLDNTGTQLSVGKFSVVK